ncbi:hypothetical protein Goklo_007687 [Gossypium klotzschianum]|uniref:Uncharacterized protein n=1 Tax=Gossypium klotzschianum TaxID=34286 RepID=A0A7J8UY70_9ROSI|nr:hypothetical protein [Gossypium klotzschianum]
MEIQINFQRLLLWHLMILLGLLLHYQWEVTAMGVAL